MRGRNPYEKCDICGRGRSLTDLHRYEGRTSKGYVCRPDRWMDDRDESGAVVRRGFVRESKTGEPCFRSLTTQSVLSLSSTTYEPIFSAYPIAPGTADWTRLLRDSGGRRAIRVDHRGPTYEPDWD